MRGFHTHTTCVYHRHERFGRSAVYGHPAWTAAFEDEAYNRVLGITARHVHAKNQEIDILVRHDLAGGSLGDFRRDYTVDYDFAKRRKTGNSKNKNI